MSAIRIVTLGASSAGPLLVLVIAGYLLLAQFLVRAIVRDIRRNSEQRVLQIGISPVELARLRATSAPAVPPPWVEPSVRWVEVADARAAGRVVPVPVLARPSIRLSA